MRRPLFRYDLVSDELKAIYRAMSVEERLELLEQLNEFTYRNQIRRRSAPLEHDRFREHDDEN